MQLSGIDEAGEWLVRNFAQVIDLYADYIAKTFANDGRVSCGALQSLVSAQEHIVSFLSALFPQDAVTKEASGAAITRLSELLGRILPKIDINKLLISRVNVNKRLPNGLQGCSYDYSNSIILPLSLTLPHHVALIDETHYPFIDPLSIKPGMLICLATGMNPSKILLKVSKGYNSLNLLQENPALYSYLFNVSSHAVEYKLCVVTRIWLDSPANTDDVDKAFSKRSSNLAFPISLVDRESGAMAEHEKLKPLLIQETCISGTKDKLMSVQEHISNNRTKVAAFRNISYQRDPEPDFTNSEAFDFHTPPGRIAEKASRTYVSRQLIRSFVGLRFEMVEITIPGMHSYNSRSDVSNCERINTSVYSGLAPIPLLEQSPYTTPWLVHGLEVTGSERHYVSSFCPNRRPNVPGINTAFFFDMTPLLDPFEDLMVSILRPGAHCLAYNKARGLFKLAVVVSSPARENRFHYTLRFMRRNVAYAEGSQIASVTESSKYPDEKSLLNKSLYADAHRKSTLSTSAAIEDDQIKSLLDYALSWSPSDYIDKHFEACEENVIMFSKFVLPLPGGCWCDEFVELFMDELFISPKISKPSKKFFYSDLLKSHFALYDK